ncbi:homogentisate 1,2-dioxygenase [Novosphingobium sp. AP12]|nr:homogentisate 1,2-dioxygenase [Novosphingobium sp. AP12]
MRPSAMHGAYPPYTDNAMRGGDGKQTSTHNRLRWNPAAQPETPVDFVDGLVTCAVIREAATGPGSAVDLYSANCAMVFSGDGELLIVPETGPLQVVVEMDALRVAPRHFALIPRGIRFRLELPDGPARGYVCEAADRLERSGQPTRFRASDRPFRGY